MCATPLRRRVQRRAPVCVRRPWRGASGEQRLHALDVAARGRQVQGANGIALCGRGLAGAHALALHENLHRLCVSFLARHVQRAQACGVVEVVGRCLPNLSLSFLLLFPQLPQLLALAFDKVARRLANILRGKHQFERARPLP